MRRSGDPVHNLLTGQGGVKALRSPWVRYCPACIAEDQKYHGETYWRRLHQAPGVLICPVHGTWLENSHVRSSSSAAKLVSAQSAQLATAACLATASPFYERLQWLTLEIKQLLALPLYAPGLDLLRTRLRRCIELRGYMSSRGLCLLP
jgi:hypothetical protein